MKDKIKTENLPEELLKELHFTKLELDTEMILEAINSLGGVANINELLVTIYDKNKIIKKRREFTMTLNKLVTRGIIKSLKGQKGVYKYER